MKHFISALIVLIFLSYKLTAQDVHFSEFYNAPLQLNPSYTGFFNGDYRLTAIYRNQWSSITVPYTTIEGSVDFRILEGVGDKNILGLGLEAFSDKAGDSQFSTNTVALSSAYSLAIGDNKKNYVSGGISAEFGDASIDYSNLVFDEQWFHPNLPTTENVSLNSYSYVDVSGGISWHYIPNKLTNFNIGFAAFHLNQPIVSFLGENSMVLYRKYIIDASSQLSLNEKLDLYPKAMLDFQGPYTELDAGGLIRCDISSGYKRNYGIYFGLFYRKGDAIIITSRVDVNELSFALSYDITTSALYHDSRAQGGPELSIIYVAKFMHSKHTVYCPRF